jgi:hypothetical protein
LAFEDIKKKTENNTKNIELVFQYLDELLEKKNMIYPEKFILITQNLQKSEIVNSHNQNKEIEAATIAHGLSDMEDSFNKIKELIPKLATNDILTTDQVEDILMSIGEELRHILYHINDMKFYDYLKDDD